LKEFLKGGTPPKKSRTPSNALDDGQKRVKDRVREGGKNGKGKVFQAGERDKKAQSRRRTSTGSVRKKKTKIFISRSFSHKGGRKTKSGT